jgi:hypothetical protein
MILSQYHIFELDTINIYSACRQGQSASMAGLDRLNNAKEAKTG